LWSLVNTDLQRPQKAPVIGGQVECLSRRQADGGCDRGHRRTVVPAHNAYDRFQSDSHVETRFPRLGAAGFNLSLSLFA
jgi:hypothetical protein